MYGIRFSDISISKVGFSQKYEFNYIDQSYGYEIGDIFDGVRQLDTVQTVFLLPPLEQSTISNTANISTCLKFPKFFKNVVLDILIAHIWYFGGFRRNISNETSLYLS